MKNGPYILVVPPASYGKRYRGRYAYEHHVVWWTHTGRLPAPGHVIHHKDLNSRNNTFTNLEEKQMGPHSREHQPPRSFVTLHCDFCGEEFKRDVRNVNHKLFSGQPHFYCCRSHQVRGQHRLRLVA